MAALAGGDGILEDLSTEQLCAAAGLPDRTYRRARQALLASGELILLSGVGGRGNTNRWQIQNPRLSGGEPRRPSSGRRAAPPAGARPLSIQTAKVRVIAVDPGGALVLDAPPEFRGWLQERFARPIEQAAERAGRATRIADVVQSAAIGRP